ncbi:MAG TPA: hypothetical protein VK871_15355 [Candidatus Limnocylindrales bacterium]|nr:hypothetical protein [Candidatus Limnocylindrales bacterium]
MGTNVRRHVAVASIGLVAALVLGPGAALAVVPPADVVLDSTVTVRHVDAFDGPIAGATITVTSYRDPAAPIQTLTATTDAGGRASLTGVARPADGAEPVLLDIRSDLATTSVDDAGCTATESWFAGMTTVPAAPEVEVLLDSTAKSLEVSCPEPTDLPAETDPSDDPGAGPFDGGVLAATGRPQITPPATDSVVVADRPAGTPAAGGLLAALLAGAVALVVPARLARRSVRVSRRSRAASRRRPRT